MDCQESQSKLRLFQEDLLPQVERYAVWKHLQSCEVCMDMAQALAGGGGNARKNLLPPEETLRMDFNAVPTALPYGEEKGKFSFSGNSSQHSDGFWGSLTGFIAVMIFVIAMLSVICYGYIRFVEPELFKAETGSDFEDLEPQTLPVVKANDGKIGVHLRPLHWDLHFPNAMNRDQLHNELHNRGIKISYEDQGLMVLSLGRENFESMITGISAANGSFKNGGSARSVSRPRTDLEFGISLALNAPQSRVSRALTHHWHVRFELPNRFVLKENIQQLGARIIYELPELWVVEIPGKKVTELKNAIQSTNGVALNLHDDFLLKEYADIPVTVSLYIEEG